MNIFLTANLKTFDEFLAAYSQGDEARTNRGNSLLSYALANTDPGERYKIVDFLLAHNPSFAHKSSDGSSLLHILLGSTHHDPKHDAIIAQTLLNHGETFNCLDKRRRLPLQYLLPLHEYSDADLTPIYDVVFTSADPGFTTVVDGGLPFHELVHSFADRQVLAERIDEYLRTHDNTRM